MISTQSLSKMTAEFVKTFLEEKGVETEGIDVIREVDVQFIQQERSALQWFMKIRINEFPICWHRTLKIIKIRSIFIGILMGMAIMMWIMK